MRSRKWICAVTAIVLACMLICSACKGNTPPQTENPPPAKITEGDVCVDIDIKTMPTKLTYKSGEKFNPAGLVFDAVYENGYDGDKGLTGGDLDTWQPKGALKDTDTQITLIFEGFEKKIDITVTPKVLLGAVITREPDITAYTIGDRLDLSGLKVKATYEEGEVENETEYVITDKDGNEYTNGMVLDKATTSLTLTVSVKAGDVVKSDTFVISVYAGLSLQAEDYWDASSGTPRPTDKSYTVLTGDTLEGRLVMHDCTYTGTGYVGNITTGVKLEFYIYSQYEIKNADLVLVAASTCQGDGKMEDMQFNKFCKVYIGEDEEEIYIDDDIILEGLEFPDETNGGSRWTNWADVPFGKIDIAPGYNKVKIDCVGAVLDSAGSYRIPNIDRLDVRLSDDDPDVVSRGDYCTDIDIKTMPTKLEYYAGDTFSAAGIVFDATYRNGYDGDVNLGADKIKFSPSGKLSTSDTKITLKFKNFTKEIDITVRERTISSVTITALPSVGVYSKNSNLNLGGLLVKAVYEDGYTETDATNYVVRDADGNTYATGDVLNGTYANNELSLFVEITSAGVTKKAPFTVKVYSGFSVEAEAVLASGEEVPADRSYVVHSGSGSGNILSDCGGNWSGTGYIGGINPTFILEFYVYSEVEVKDAEVYLIAASTAYNEAERKMDDLNFNQMFKVYVGDDNQKVDIDDEFMIKGKPWPHSYYEDVIWVNWTDTLIATMDLKAGFNKITVECYGHATIANGEKKTPNIDRLDVRF